MHRVAKIWMMIAAVARDDVHQSSPTRLRFQSPRPANRDTPIGSDAMLQEATALRVEGNLLLCSAFTEMIAR
jgi:hypothetical protein